MNTKKLFYGMSITLSILVVAILVYAYSGENPAVHGHAVSELGGLDLQNRNFSGDWAFSGTVTAAEPTDDHNVATKGWVEANTGGGYSAFGTDMVTRHMDNLGLFEPHEDDCGVGEYFIPLYSGASVGFCMETGERTAAQWTEARADCLSDGKRLPETGEYKYACNNYNSYFTQLYGDAWEWSSNFQILAWYSSHGSLSSLSGNTNCNTISWGWVGDNSGSTSSFEYRCVR